jgi:cell division protein ZipA
MTPAQLRWILLIIGVVFLGALAWWERRRPRQAVGGSAGERAEAGRVRAEPTLTLPAMRAREPEPPHELPVVEAGAVLAADSAGDSPIDEVAAAAPQERSAPIEESFGYVPKAHSPPPPSAQHLPPAAAAMPPRETLPELPGGVVPTVEWPPDEQRSIVAVRLIAPAAERFAGRSLRQALAAEGFVLGRFSIFHKPDESRRAVLSAASLTRPGTFDADTMDSQHYGGLSLFAVLPGPKAPPQAFDELVFTARSLNERLHGVLQDEQGSPLTPARIALLRERLNTGATL